MAGYVILGFFAAFGALSALWTVFGQFLPGGSGVVVCPEGPELLSCCRRLSWLRQLGLARYRLAVTGSILPPRERERLRKKYPWIEFYSPEEPLLRLSKEQGPYG